MPVKVKDTAVQKKYIIADIIDPKVRKTIEASSLLDAALAFAKNLGYEIFEDFEYDIEEAAFVMIETTAKDFNIKEHILADVLKNKKRPYLALPAPRSGTPTTLKSVGTDLCVKGTCGDGQVQPLGDEFMGKAKSCPVI